MIPDLQIPYHDKKTIKAVNSFIKTQFFDELLYIGDFLDLDCISHFNRKAPKNLLNKSLEKDFEEGRQFLDEQINLVRYNNPECKVTLLEGNHEHRVERWVTEFPQFSEFMDIERNLQLKDKKVKYVKSWSEGKLYKIGNAYFTHGLYYGDNHAKKMVDRYGVNIYYGHTHDVMSYAKVLHGKDKTIEGHSLGCLCRYDQSYIKGKPTNWQQAFAVGYFYPNGYYNLYVTRIFNHKFIGVDGKEYGG